MPALAVHRLDPVPSVAIAFLRRCWRASRAAAGARAAEVAARPFLSYCLTPPSVVDFTDPDSVRRYARTFVLPGLVSDTTPAQELTCPPTKN